MKSIKIILIILTSILFILFFQYRKPEEVQYYPAVEESFATITKYYIYGQSLNIAGNLNKIVFEDDIRDISLMLVNEQNELNINTTYEINVNGINFKTSDEINNGIYLDDMAIGNYYLVLKINYNNDEIEYYSLKNNTNYNDLDYYTLTKDQKNNYITMKFVNRKIDKKNIPLVKVSVKEIELPEGVYDIVIDPGHGGIDSGASKSNFRESLIALEIARKLHTQLTSLGLKVKLTRDGDYNPGGEGVDPYWHNGRVNMANNVRAKYLFSIHLNSAPYVMKKGGVEIYAPINANLDLAKSLADNIVKYARTTYSPNHFYQKFDGVYVRTFTTAEITQSILDAKNRGHQPYDITSNTIYHYIIRETGGIATNAYIDGRNKKYNKNNYYDYNIGIESYLIELGFMVNNNDLYNLVHNKGGYALGIKEGIKNFLISKGYSL
jgi:N-acetylmuramoyl-L-alanine amidase